MTEVAAAAECLSPERTVNNSYYISMFQTLRLLQHLSIDRRWIDWAQVCQNDLKGKSTQCSLKQAFKEIFIQFDWLGTQITDSIQAKFNKLFKWQIMIVTSLFSFKSILQCSLDTWGSWMRISHSGFLRRSQNTRRVRRGGTARQNVARYTTKCFKVFSIYQHGCVMLVVIMHTNVRYQW